MEKISQIISKVKEEILIAQFIFSNKLICVALLKAAHRGVKIRMLIDAREGHKFSNEFPV